MNSLSLYIHIPFCERKCYYCDFTSFPKEGKDINKYIENVIKELSMYKTKLSNYKVDTIFIGGGTPTSIDENYIKKILDFIYNNFNIEDLIEVTIEANPGTINLYKAKLYKSYGINRVSLGVQSLNDNLLKAIGRIHTSKDIINSLNILRNAGFKNINVDLMFGLPGQELNDIDVTLKKVIDYNVEHISFYGLIIEDGTLINKWYKKGLISLPDEDLERIMYSRIVDFLKANGYIHYEISNFSKLDNKCQHNLVYWKVKPYLGVGASSHSNIFGKRFWNYSNLNDYTSKLDKYEFPVEGEEIINLEMEMAEYCILGLRLIEGINKEDFLKRFSIDIKEKYKNVIIKHKKNGLIKEDNQIIKLTNKGLDLANLVEVDFMP